MANRIVMLKDDGFLGSLASWKVCPGDSESYATLVAQDLRRIVKDSPTLYSDTYGFEVTVEVRVLEKQSENVPDCLPSLSDFRKMGYREVVDPEQTPPV
jgi:hypothetical protein